MKTNTYIPSKDEKNLFFNNSFTYIPSNLNQNLDNNKSNDNDIKNNSSIPLSG